MRTVTSHLSRISSPTLYMCYKELDQRFAVVHGKKVTKKARVEATVLNSPDTDFQGGDLPDFARCQPPLP